MFPQPFPVFHVAPPFQAYFLFSLFLKKEVFQVFHPLETRMDKGFDWNTAQCSVTVPRVPILKTVTVERNPAVARVRFACSRMYSQVE